MKQAAVCIAALAGATIASAQSWGPPRNFGFLGLSTPTIVSLGQGYAGLNYRAFGGDDKLQYVNVLAGYGFSKNVDVEFLGDFANFNTFTGPTGTIRYGGSDGEIRVRSLVEAPIPITVQAGVAYIDTPAQPNRVAGTLGASVGYSLMPGTHVFAEPKAVLLYKNSLLGIAFGVTQRIAPGIEAMATWTPLLAGQNTIGTQSLNRTQVQLFGLGLRFTQLIHGLTLDVAFTNTLGNSTGDSLTPSLGGAGGLSVAITHRF